MPSPSVFAAFAAASLALLIVPGPSVLYIVTRSVQGRAAGVASVLGIHTGSIVHVLAAALGVSAILASSAVAFGIVKYVGAAYLIWLGIRTLARREVEEVPDVPARSRSLRQIYAQGVVVNVLNPKTALFFLAFLPQFVDPSNGSVTLQVVALGLTFITLGLLSDGTYALVSARVSRHLIARRGSAGAGRWVPGVTLIALGVVAAFTDRRSATT